MELAELRMKRAEQDIETLRTAQSALIDQFAGFADTLDEALEIARDNRSRLERVEERLELLEEVVLENRDLIRENRAILLAIADHLDLSYEKPSPGFVKE